MAEQSVTLQPGESKQVSFEAIPHEAKLYHVSVDGLTGSFIAVSAAIVPFTFSNVNCNRKNYPFPSSWQTIEWWCTITNPNNAVVTQTLSLMYDYYMRGKARWYTDKHWWTFEHTLNPNQAYEFYYDGGRYGERDPNAYNGPDIGSGDKIRLYLRDAYGNESPKCTA